VQKNKEELLNRDYEDVYEEVDDETYNELQRQRLAEDDWMEFDDDDNGYR
jgi:hypothetical protein